MTITIPDRVLRAGGLILGMLIGSIIGLGIASAFGEVDLVGLAARNLWFAIGVATMTLSEMGVKNEQR